MANHASALKRHRQSLKRRARNRAIRSRIRTERKKLWAAIDSGDSAAVEAQLRVLQKQLDMAVSKGVLHRNTAARLLSRAAARVRSAA